MKRVLTCWIGLTDLRAVTEESEVGVGPIAQAVDARCYDGILLISDYPKKKIAPYLKWLAARTSAEVVVSHESLSSPTSFGEIYEAAVRTIEEARTRHMGEIEFTFHLSPGTPAMAAVWIILAKTRYPAGLIESSKAQGVQTVSVPFDISADFIPDLLRRPDEKLEQLSAGLPPEAPEFDDIVHRGTLMKRVIAKARRVAPRSVPVLIEGESGTGKELLARAIHKSSPRQDKIFLAVNCGAIPGELIESELFGHVRGAFTGATRSKEGYFEAANGGSLFLDEVGELPVQAQVKLLRVLQEEEVLRVGSTRPVRVDVRVIAATNRVLTMEIARGRFREDLFYRLAVAVLQLPPLRERQEDVGLIVDHVMKNTNLKNEQDLGSKHKKLSPSARNLLLSHPWPGNVRELINTILRAAIWTTNETISADDVRDALLPNMPGSAGQHSVLNRSLGNGLDLNGLIAEVARHYMERALSEAKGNKTLAAKLVGLPSYQTFTNWMKKYGISV